MKTLMKCILVWIIYFGVVLDVLAQPVDYTVKVLQTQWFEGGIFGACYEGGTEEYTAKAWFHDNLNATNTGGPCITCSANGNCTQNADYTLGTRTSTCATTVTLRFEAWEDDGNRCSYGSGDDCHCGPSNVANINFRNSGPGCTNYGYYGCNTGNHRFLAQICWNYVGPTNTSCASATTVSAGSTAYTLPTTTCGTDITSCAFNDDDALWYAYTPQCSYSATFSTCGSGYDTAISVWSACTSGQLACNDDACGLQSSVTLNVNQGTTYYVRISGYASASGSGTLNISAPPIPTVQGFGCNQWNVNVYNGNSTNLAANFYTGYYVEGNLSYSTINRYCNTCSPASASGYIGCDPGIDYHSVVSKRTCFPCGIYRLDVPNHDDGAYLFVNGALVWSHNGCCDSHTNVWTGFLSNSSTVEFRHFEGVGGSNQQLNFINVTPAVTSGSITGNQSLCPGGNPSVLSNTGLGGGGTGTITYRWQQSPGCTGSWTNIGSATGTSYNPPVLNSTTCYRRIATDPCGTTAISNTITITISDNSPPSIICPGPQSINANTNCEASLGNYTGSSMTSDNCPGTINVTQSPAPGTIISGPTLVTLTALDPAGNSSTCTFNVTLNDITNPTISCPANRTVNSDAGSCNAVVNFTLPTVMDNCPLFTFTQGSITYTYIGTYNGHYYYSSNIGLSANAANSSAIAAGSTYGVTSHLVTIDDATENDIVFQASVMNNINLLIGYTDQDFEGNFGWFGGCCGGGGSGYTNWFTGEPNNSGGNEDYTHIRPFEGGRWNDINNLPANRFVIEMYGMPQPLVTCSANSGDTFPVGTTTVSCSTIDSGGNSASCSFTITVVDNEDPTISCPGNIIRNVTSGTCGTVVNYSVGSADNCAGQTVSQTAGIASGAVFPLGTTTNSFTVTDAAGNTANCSFTVTIRDSQNPTISCPSNISLGINPGVCGRTVTYSVTSSDNCPGQTVSQTNGLPSGSLFPVGTTTNNFTVTDAAGNTANCSFTVSITDNEDPTISCPANISQVVNPGVCGRTVTYSVTSADNCPGETISQTSGLPSGSLFPVGTTTNNFTVTDAAGNTAICSFTITITDNEDPTISCPANISQVVNPGVCGRTVTYTVTSADNCPGETISQTSGLPSGSLFPVGTTTNNFTVTDAAGNTAICSFTITITDDEDPTISCPANISQVVNPGVCGRTVTYVVTSADNCPGEAISQTSGLPSGSLFPVGTTTNNFTVTDAAGNTANCSFTITITDDEDPMISCPANISQGVDPGVCGRTVAYVVTTADNCSGESISQTNGLPSGSVFPVGATTNSFTVTDAAGNTANCSFTVTITDDEDPVVNCPASISQGVDAGNCGAIVNFTVPYTDNCPGSSIVQLSGQASGTTFPLGTTTNTFMVTDAVGNTANCSFDVIIIDDEEPTISCPATIIQNTAASSCGANITYVVTSDDNCPGESITQTAGLPSGAFFPIGNTTNSFLATDAAGNTSTCSFDVVVNDMENPTITCPSNITQNTTAGSCNTIIIYNVTSADNCPGQTVTQLSGLASGANFPIGTTTNVFQATDASGNTSTCSFDVIINDAEAPTISCPSTITQNISAGSCVSIVNYTVTAADNCPGETVTQTAGLASGASFPVGTTTNLFTVTDAAGNTATCSFDVVIIDNENPTISCPSNINQGVDLGVCGATITYTINSTDNCPGETILQTAGLASGDVFPVGTTINSFTVSDLAGNVATCSFLVTIVDDEDPTASCPPAITRSADPGTCGTLVTFNVPPTDNCPGATIMQTSGILSGTVAPIGTITNTFIITDAAGNTNSCSFDITVTDDEFPVLNCIPNLTVQLNQNLIAVVSINDLTTTFSDNCNPPVVQVVSGQTNYECNDVGQSFTLMLEATDASGNMVTCQSIVTVADDDNPCNLPPTAVCKNLTLPADMNCQATATANDFDNGSIDPEMGTLTFSVSPTGPYSVGTTNVTLTVTDPLGASASCNATITVSDAVLPTISCPSAISQNADAGACAKTITYSISSTDNCPGQIVTQTAGLPSGMAFPIGTTTNVFSVVDAAGNIATCSFDVTILDTEVPGIVCPSTIVRNNTAGICNSMVTYTVTTSDNCPGETITQTAGLASGAVFPVGTTTNSFVVSDGSGNSVSCSFDVVVSDGELPVATCPAAITQPTDAGGCTAIVNYITPTFNDNCDGPGLTATLVSGLASGSTFPIGTTTVTYSYTDMAGNGPVNCSFDVIVEDQMPPIATCQNLTISLNTNGQTTIAPADLNDGSTDNCGITSMQLSQTTFDCSDSGANQVILTVTDASGNSSTCASTITIEGTPIPIFDCPSPILQTCDGTFSCNFNDQNLATVNIVSATVSGSAAQYLQGDITPGGNAYFDPLNMPLNVPLTLVYTLTIGPCSTVSTTCTFTVVEAKQSDAGRF